MMLFAIGQEESVSYRYDSKVPSTTESQQIQMYVRVATAQIKPGMLDELSKEMVRGFEEAFAQGRQVPGFVGHQFMINRESNKIAIISRWATETDEAASRQGNAQQQFAKLAAYFADRPVVEGYEVKFEV